MEASLIKSPKFGSAFSFSLELGIFEKWIGNQTMKYKYQRPDYAPVLRSTLPDIGDTILGSVCLQDFWSSLVNEEKTPLAGKILESGLAQAGRHPISV